MLEPRDWEALRAWASQPSWPLQQAQIICSLLPAMLDEVERLQKQEAELQNLIGNTTRYMDPPDGGDPTLVEELKNKLDEAERLISGAMSIVANCSVESGVCGCGNDMENHGFFEGHSPVDYGQYVADGWFKQAKEFLN